MKPLTSVQVALSKGENLDFSYTPPSITSGVFDQIDENQQEISQESRSRREEEEDQSYEKEVEQEEDEEVREREGESGGDYDDDGDDEDEYDDDGSYDGND